MLFKDSERIFIPSKSSFELDFVLSWTPIDSTAPDNIIKGDNANVTKLNYQEAVKAMINPTKKDDIA